MAVSCIRGTAPQYLFMSVWNLKCTVSPFKFPLSWGVKKWPIKSFLLEYFILVRHSLCDALQDIIKLISNLLALAGSTVPIFFDENLLFNRIFSDLRPKFVKDCLNFGSLTRLLLELVSFCSILYGFWSYSCRNWNSFCWIHEDLQSRSFFQALILLKGGGARAIFGSQRFTEASSNLVKLHFNSI